MKTLARCAVLGVLLMPVLSACTGFTLVKNGEPAAIGSELEVTPGQDWNRHVTSDAEIWTLDGIQLQHIMFVKGTEDGESLYGKSPKGEEKFPQFRQDMGLLEVVELLEETMTREGWQQIDVQNVRPFGFGQRDGFRLDIDFLSEDGLIMKGEAAGAIYDGKLFMAIYRGTRLHFFERGRADFHRMVENLRFPAPAKTESIASGT